MQHLKIIFCQYELILHDVYNISAQTSAKCNNFIKYFRRCSKLPYYSFVKYVARNAIKSE